MSQGLRFSVWGRGDYCAGDEDCAVWHGRQMLGLIVRDGGDFWFQSEAGVAPHERTFRSESDVKRWVESNLESLIGGQG